MQSANNSDAEALLTLDPRARRFLDLVNAATRDRSSAPELVELSARLQRRSRNSRRPRPRSSAAPTRWRTGKVSDSAAPLLAGRPRRSRTAGTDILSRRRVGLRRSRHVQFAVRRALSFRALPSGRGRLSDWRRIPFSRRARRRPRRRHGRRRHSLALGDRTERASASPATPREETSRRRLRVGQARQASNWRCNSCSVQCWIRSPARLRDAIWRAAISSRKRR